LSAVLLFLTLPPVGLLHPALLPRSFLPRIDLPRSSLLLSQKNLHPWPVPALFRGRPHQNHPDRPAPCCHHDPGQIPTLSSSFRFPALLTRRTVPLPSLPAQEEAFSSLSRKPRLPDQGCSDYPVPRRSPPAYVRRGP